MNLFTCNDDFDKIFVLLDADESGTLEWEVEVRINCSKSAEWLLVKVCSACNSGNKSNAGLIQEFKTLIQHESSCNTIVDFIPLKEIQAIDFEVKEIGDGNTKRDILCKGYMKKRGQKNSAFKHRFLVLDAEGLKWYKNEDDFKRNPNSYLGAMASGSLETHFTQELGVLKDDVVFSVSGEQIPKHKARTLHLKVGSVGERDAWIDEISHAANQAKASAANKAVPLQQDQNKARRKMYKGISVLRKIRHKAVSLFESLTGAMLCACFGCCTYLTEPTLCT